MARRLQNPLGELVKVEPKHLGVGMYQHDVSEKHLSSTLDEVVSECVSFVGVDINTASQIVLRYCIHYYCYYIYYYFKNKKNKFLLFFFLFIKCKYFIGKLTLHKFKEN